ncbi:MAG: hypothetical protein CMA22_04095, partial [Euryarchaeota archaeon]|nr:hypothetical protein [Euryarchaeota archaeon]
MNASGGSLIIDTISTEANAGSAISDITMSYTHTHPVNPWVSGVENTTELLIGNRLITYDVAIDTDNQGEVAVAYGFTDSDNTGTLALSYQFEGIISDNVFQDNGADTGFLPSLVIDSQGALHIAYINETSQMVEYLTNSSGTWDVVQLGSAVVYSGPEGITGTAITLHPTTGAIHVVATAHDGTNHNLVHYTDETGTWIDNTISNTVEDDGYSPKVVIDGDGNIHSVYHSNPLEIKISSRINGIWQNETIPGLSSNSGKNLDMVIDSQDVIHIIGAADTYSHVYSGTLGNWAGHSLGTPAFYPAIAVDSNDNLHAVYHVGQPKKLMYTNYISGTWSTATQIDDAGWTIGIDIDDNDDLFVAHSRSTPSIELRLTSHQGTGQGLATNPIFEVSPELPDGLTMNWRNGTISGTPTEGHANTTHTVTVTAFGTTTSETFTLMVLEAPDISYAGSPFTFTKNSTVNVATPTNIGGVADSWTVISGTLPNGVTLDSSTGELVGTPTAVSTVHSIVIQATNPAGSGFTTIQITVQDEAPDISYPGSPFLWTKGTHTINAPSNDGGSSTSYSVTSGTLPAGIFLPPGSGYLIGTPTAVYATASVTITATNSAGSSSTTVSITVQDEAPDISYAGSPFTFTKNTEVVGETPTNAGGAVSTWEIHPAASTLPSGLLFGPSNGTIYGTPTAVTSTATFTVWANNSADDVSTTISITVQDEAADISYANSPFTFTKNDPVSGETPTNSGGVPDGWEITPDISISIPGLSFNPANGVITGTPTAVTSAVMFTVWANNSADDISTTISITVQDEAADISYAGSPFTFTKNDPVSGETPTNV